MRSSRAGEPIAVVPYVPRAFWALTPLKRAACLSCDAKGSKLCMMVSWSESTLPAGSQLAEDNVELTVGASWADARLSVQDMR